MKRSAVLAFPDDQGEPQARLVLERDLCPNGPGVRTAAWLMCNPSRASHEIDDPTAGRVVHHSARNGCDRSLIGNVWGYRTPYPDDLWAWLVSPDAPLRAAIACANLDALAMISAQADIHVVAYGAVPGRKYQAHVAAALDAFSLGGSVPLYCLGTTADGHPLHPLARGKHAVRNDAELRLWRAAKAVPERSWDSVFSDLKRSPHGSWSAPL